MPLVQLKHDSSFNAHRDRITQTQSAHKKKHNIPVEIETWTRNIQNTGS